MYFLSKISLKYSFKTYCIYLVNIICILIFNMPKPSKLIYCYKKAKFSKTIKISILQKVLYLVSLKSVRFVLDLKCLINQAI